MFPAHVGRLCIGWVMQKPGCLAENTATKQDLSNSWEMNRVCERHKHFSSLNFCLHWICSSVLTLLTGKRGCMQPTFDECLCVLTFCQITLDYFKIFILNVVCVFFGPVQMSQLRHFIAAPKLCCSFNCLLMRNENEARIV